MRESFARYTALLALLVVASCNAQPKLISRQALFGAPAHIQVRLSPDGKYMSFLAPEDGVLNIWVAPRDDPKAAKALTDDRAGGINVHMWAPDGRTILYQEDRSGNQNWHVYALDAATGHEVDLTPFENVQARILAMSAAHPNEVLLTINKRDPRWPDVYMANIKTGALTLVEQNTGFLSFVADNDLKLRFATALDPDGSLQLFQMQDGKWVAAGKVPRQDALTFRLLGFDSTDKRIYMLDSRGRDTSALTRYTPTTGETEILGQDPRADIATVLIQPRTHQVQAFTVDDERTVWKVIDPAVDDDLKALSAAAGKDGDFDVVDRTYDDKTWVVHIDQPTQPGTYYLYDTGTRKLTKLFTTQPALDGAPLVPMHAVTIKARDGLSLTAYYTLPKEADPDGDGKPRHRSPMVVMVHGGPWGRDQYGFNEWHQWLANRGYAVLSVNFRGSTGFGKAFINAANRQWGKAMLHDIEDGVHWAIKEGIADPKKIAILGGQYGGYAALEELATADQTYACGVALGGPSNLVTMMKTIPPYWTFMKDILLQRVGDPSTPDGLKELEQQSPELHARAIKKPLLLVQGANDPQSSQTDNQALVKTLKDDGVPVTYILYPDEGALLFRRANRFAFYAIAEAFLGKCLGGRVEPIGNALAGSSAQIVEGGDQIPGLIDAMARASQDQRANQQH